MRKLDINGTIRVPLTAAQSARIARLMNEANAAATARDNVLSALVESVSDQDFRGWQVNITDKEIVLTPPSAPAAPQGNGIKSQVKAMST